MLDNKLDFRYFIVSFAIGILYVYMYQPEKKIVYKFQNPNNLDTIYKDKNDKKKLEGFGLKKKKIFSNINE